MEGQMTKSKINESIIDTIISKLFLSVGKSARKTAIKQIKKTDPDLARQIGDLEKTRREIEKTLTRKQKSQLARNELPDIVKKYMTK